MVLTRRSIPRIFAPVLDRWCAKWFVVGALTLSLGAHWFLLQSVAWASMIVRYSQEESLSAAVSKTFDGEHLCKLCKLVREGKKAEKPIEIVKVDADKKMVSEAAIFIPLPPSSFSLNPEATEAAQLRSHSPPLPPPRGQFA
jgi:hypothetical protein